MFLDEIDTLLFLYVLHNFLGEWTMPHECPRNWLRLPLLYCKWCPKMYLWTSVVWGHFVTNWRELLLLWIISHAGLPKTRVRKTMTSPTRTSTCTDLVCGNNLLTLGNVTARRKLSIVIHIDLILITKWEMTFVILTRYINMSPPCDGLLLSVTLFCLWGLVSMLCMRHGPHEIYVVVELCNIETKISKMFGAWGTLSVATITLCLLKNTCAYSRHMKRNSLAKQMAHLLIPALAMEIGQSCSKPST